MSAGYDPVKHIGKEWQILFSCGIHACRLAVLLDAPCSPKRNVGEIDGIDAAVEHLIVHVVAVGFGGSVHDVMEIFIMTYGESCAGKCDEDVARSYFSPRIARHDVFTVGVLDVELLCSVFQTVVET